VPLALGDDGVVMMVVRGDGEEACLSLLSCLLFDKLDLLSHRPFFDLLCSFGSDRPACWYLGSFLWQQGRAREEGRFPFSVVRQNGSFFSSSWLESEPDAPGSWQIQGSRSCQRRVTVTVTEPGRTLPHPSAVLLRGKNPFRPSADRNEKP
jgi:hypothetical protein